MFRSGKLIGIAAVCLVVVAAGALTYGFATAGGPADISGYWQNVPNSQGGQSGNAEVFHISQQRSSLNIQYVADAGNGVVSAGSPNGCVAVMNVGGSGTMNGDSGSFALTLPFTASQKARVEAHGDATSISGTLQLEGKELIVNETGSSASGTIVLVPSSSSYCQSALHCPLIAPGS